MRTERISELSNRIFNTNLSEPRTQRTSNPFADTPSMSGGSMINLNPELFVNADVFAAKTSAKLGIKEKLTARSKRIYSAFVGSINDFTESFYAGLNAVKEFGRTIKDNVVSAFHKFKEIGDTEITLSGIGKSLAALVPVAGGIALWNSRERQIDKMSKQSPAELAEMFVNHLAKLEEANSIVAVA